MILSKKMLSAISILLFSIILASCGKSSASKCPATPQDLVKAMKTAYDNKDGGALYDIISKKSTAEVETKMKAYAKMAEGYMKAAAKLKPNSEMSKALGMIKDVTSASGREFFVQLVKLAVVLGKGKMPASVDLSLVDSKIDGDKGVITVSANKDKQAIPVMKEDGCLKIYIPSQSLDFNKLFK